MARSEKWIIDHDGASWPRPRPARSRACKPRTRRGSAETNASGQDTEEEALSMYDNRIAPALVASQRPPRLLKDRIECGGFSCTQEER